MLRSRGLRDKRADPSLYGFILYDPHTPYAPPEPYRSEYGSRGLVGLYDGEIAFMDEQIGRCLSWLDTNGLRGRTIVAAIGDHGEGLGDHGERTHGYFIMTMPCTSPSFSPRRLKKRRPKSFIPGENDRSVSNAVAGSRQFRSRRKSRETSLWPLIAGANGAGENLFAYSESMAPSIQYGWSPLLGLRTAHYKYIDAPRPEFYDLEKEPGEEKDVRGDHTTIADEYQSALKTLVATTSAGAPTPNAANLTPRRTNAWPRSGTSGPP